MDTYLIDSKGAAPCARSPPQHHAYHCVSVSMHVSICIWCTYACMCVCARRSSMCIQLRMHAHKHMHAQTHSKTHENLVQRPRATPGFPDDNCLAHTQFTRTQKRENDTANDAQCDPHRHGDPVFRFFQEIKSVLTHPRARPVGIILLRHPPTAVVNIDIALDTGPILLDEAGIASPFTP
jgi:hypothetical protein